MTSFEINCPPSLHGCDRIDVYAEHQTTYSDFHLIKDGKPVTIIQRQLNGGWQYKSGKELTVEELAFISKQIESN